MPSFTSEVSNLEQAGPIARVKVSISTVLENALKTNRDQIPVPLTAMAMIDTGATATVVNKELIQGLGLQPVGTTLIHTPSSTNVQCDQYLVRLFFQNGVQVENVIVIAAPLQNQHIQCLTGRDVLRHAVFVYLGYKNQYTLSF